MQVVIPFKRSKPMPLPTYELGDLLINYLEQIGVEYVFGIPGGAIEPLFNALAKSVERNSVKPVISRHESGAAFMADGYYRSTGKLAVCCATTGPGATNLITGVASAMENRIPMLVITAQTALPTFGRQAFQESSCTGINTVALFEHITKRSTLVSHPEQFEQKLTAAIISAFQNNRGPVHLSIPTDVMQAIATNNKPQYDLTELLGRPASFNTSDANKLISTLKSATKPCLLIGEGVSKAIKPIMVLVNALQIPFMVTPHAKGLVNSEHPLFHGVYGFAGHQSAQQLLHDPQVDLIVAVNANFSEWGINGWAAARKIQNKLVHIASIESDFQSTPMAQLHLLDNIERLFEHINRLLAADVSTHQNMKSNIPPLPKNHLPTVIYDDVNATYSNTRPIKPQRLMRLLTEYFPSNTHYFADVGNSFAWTTHYLNLPNTAFDDNGAICRGSYQASIEFAAMGWAIGAAIGFSIGSPDDPVVCITGDGSVLMNGQELTVAIEQNLSVIFVILNDSSLGMVKHGQRLTGAKQIGSSLSEVDFEILALSMGARAYSIYDPLDFENFNFKELCRKTGPTVLNVWIDPEQVPPISQRTADLANTKAIVLKHPESC